MHFGLSRNFSPFPEISNPGMNYGMDKRNLGQEQTNNPQVK